MASFAGKEGGPLPKADEEDVRKVGADGEDGKKDGAGVAPAPAVASSSSGSSSSSGDGDGSSSSSSDVKEAAPFDPRHPLTVVYCPTCSMPPEYCEFGQTFDKCLPWIRENCPEALSPSVLAALMGEVSLEDADKKQRGGGAAAKKTKAAKETKVVIARIQRQKKKFVTAVVGLDSVPDLNIKDAAKLFGKKFSSGASVGESPSGQKEVTIQGDVTFDLPPLLMKEFKVPPSCIYFLEDDGKSLRPYE